MAVGNGHSTDGMNGAAVSFDLKKETSPFKIGGKEIPVPVMSMWDIKRLRERIDMDTDIHWIDMADRILRIVAILLAPDEADDASATHAALLKACSMEEMRGLGASYNELLKASGFIMGEAEPPEQAANRGTGTSTESPPISQFEESAEETPSESSKL